MTRENVPKKTRETLFAEYEHSCAICRADRPHIHHIDEDPSNNDLDNLLPLCPNCHLTDQHNPTRKIDIPKLQLLRKYKDPSILKPQFHPIYIRQTFLDDVEINDETIDVISQQANELTEFVAAFEMGDFYSKRIKKLVSQPATCFVISLGPGPDHEYERQRKRANLAYRQKLIDNKNAIQSLLVEMLRYQPWANLDTE